MLGVEPEQADTVVGTSLQSILVPDQHECSLNCLKNIITADTTSHVVGFETMMVRLDTSTFPVEVTCGQIVWDGTLATQITVRDITERKHAEEEVKRSREELAQAYDATLAGWSKALEIRDKETEGHSQRVTDMTVRIARAMGICGEDLEHVRRGAILHDIGKMGIPDSILLKNGPLTDEEWVIMRQHPVYAYEWLRPITYLHPSLDIPYCHHEKWDGTGYPRGLSGEDIPLSARIFAVVDVWDALSYDRPYRSAWPQEKVRQHIRTLSGTHFDPDVVDVFFSLLG
jgi:putative nucleotidyltransferase with HDIG domain